MAGSYRRRWFDARTPRPVAVFGLFSLGLDLGLEAAGVEPVCFVESDDDCAALIRQRRPGVRIVRDVRDVDASLLAEVGPVELVAGGFPCFPAGTLILARRGLVPIEEIREGDFVWTHRARWRRVVRHHGSHLAPTVELRGFGHPNLVCTANHPLWTRSKRRVWDRAVKNWRWILSDDAGWTRADEARGRFWASPSGISAETVPPVVPLGRESGAEILSEDFFWFVGKWVADGHSYAEKRVVLSCAIREAGEVERRLVGAGLAFSRDCRASTVQIHVTRAAVTRWLLEHFGKGAAGKTIPTWLLGAPIPLRRAFLDGYLAGDGSQRPSGDFAATTVSRGLAVGVRLLAQTLGYAVSVYRNEPNPTKVIEGRTVNQRPWYQLVLRLKSRSAVDGRDGFWYGLVRGVEETGSRERVYNFEVDEDNSYVADGVVAKNCQDLSYAGRGAGLDGDRSGLWFEMARVVRELRPRLVLVENVPGLLTRGLGVVVHELALAGYVGRWFTLGAVDVGAPHRRERVFVIARRADASRVEPLGGGHASGLLRDDGWFSPQESLFDSSPLLRLGKRGRWTLDAVYEDDPRLAIDDDSDATLLPTPNAYESTPTGEFVDEMREAGVDPEARLYLPGRKHHVQRTLSRVAPMIDEVGQDGAEGEALLPTPGAWLGRRPENSMADPERAASREHEGTRGKRSVELPDALAAAGVTDQLLPTPDARDGKGISARGDRRDGYERSEADGCLPNAVRLLPTPVVTDSFGSRRSTARTDEWTSNPGTTLTDAVWEAQGRETDTGGKLLPTPQKSDGDGGRLDRNPETVATGKRPSGSKASVPLATAIDLLPTPDASANRKSTRAMTSSGAGDGNGKRSGGGMSSPPGLEQVAELAAGEAPADLPAYADLPPQTREIVDSLAGEVRWGVYEPAVRRWESVLGREAPAPTDEKGRLAPAFVEWMMGFDDGWTDVGISRTARLRLLGNAVHVLVGARVALAAIALDRQLSPESSPACA